MVARPVLSRFLTLSACEQHAQTLSVQGPVAETGSTTIPPKQRVLAIPLPRSQSSGHNEFRRGQASGSFRTDRGVAQQQPASRTASGQHRTTGAVAHPQQSQPPKPLAQPEQQQVQAPDTSVKE